MRESSRLTRINAAVATVVIGCALACASALAQEPDPQTTAPDAPAPVATIPVGTEPTTAPEKGTTQLDDIVVTATKRAQSLRDIAASIDAFSGEKLESEGKINLADYIETKPGVTISNIAPNLLRVSIRGISTDTHGGSPLPSPTGVFIGDTAFSDPYIANIQPDFNAFDLSSVEILKGPQGTLFGGAALAGAIRFVMQEPILGMWQSRGFSQYDLPKDGSPALSYGAVLNAPLGDNFAARLGYMKREYPAVFDNSRQDVGRKDVDGGLSDQFRGLLSWRPFDWFGIKVTHLEQESFTPDGVGFADTPDGPRENNKKILPQPSYADFSLDSVELGYDFDTMRAVLLSSKNFKSWDAYVDGTAALYSTAPEGFNPNNSGFQAFIDISNGRTHELRLQSTDTGGVQWLGGLYYFDYDVFFEIFIDTLANQQAHGASGYPGDLNKSPQAQATSLTYAVSNVTAYEKAAFADFSYKFFDRLDVSLGARWYETQVKGGFYGTGSLPRSQNNGQDINYTDNEITEDGVNPKISAAYEVSPAVTVWSGASRGFRFGGLQSVPSPGPTGPNGSDNVPESFKSDTLWNYELGARTSWFDNTLHFDTTLFYVDYQNPQLVQTTVNGQINYNYIDNVAAARSQGIETGLTWLTPLDGVRLDLGAGLTDAVTTEDFRAAGNNLVPAGAKMPGATDYQYSGALAYVAPQLGMFNLAGRVDYTYVGPGKGDIRQIQDINDYGALNAGLTLTTLAWGLKPTLNFNVSNINDVIGLKLVNTIRPVSGAPYTVHYMNAPRTFSLRLGLEF